MAACTTAPPVAPTSAPAPTAAAQPKAVAQPTASSQSTEMEQLVAAAKREGQVAVMGPAGTDARDALTIPFQEKYGITVEYIGGSSRDMHPRLREERAANQFLWDVRVGGALVADLPEMGAIDPIEPLLLPEIADPSVWRGGELKFSDGARHIITMTPFQRATIFVNPDLVDPASITSYKDLLDPKWKGKMIADDPLRTGPGQATWTFFYLHPDLGPDFMRSLAQQELTLSRDFQQEVDAVGQGQFPILIGTADFIAEQRAKDGVPIFLIDPTKLKEGADVSPANGEMALISRAPHPNAAKLYINWLLSQEGQTEFVRKMGYVSGRVDVPTDHAAPWRVPPPGAIKTYEDAVRELQEKEITPLVTELLGGR